VVELHWEGSVPAACAAGLFIVILPFYFIFIFGTIPIELDFL
jgi:hypothetical protein